MLLSIRTLLAAAVAAVCFLGPGAAGAQPVPEPGPGCARALVLADSQYAEQVYSAVEPLLLECFSDLSATPLEVQQSYRLLALAFIKQGLLPEAHQAIARLLYADSEYTADPLVDLPAYIDLVAEVRQELSRASPGFGPLPISPPVPAETRQPLADPARPPATRERVDINAADLDALDTLPGIGPILAERIIAYREQHGAFPSVESLAEVRGIGTRTLERMLPFVTAGPEVAPRQAPGGATSAEAPRSLVAPVSPPLVNLNTATAEELETLPGIGPALAARIVEFRASHGPFQALSDVMQVRGIGAGKLEGFADRVTLR